MAVNAEVSPTPEVTTATPAAPEPVAATGTAEASGSEAQVAEAAPSAEETFYSGDPNSLPPEIREKYNAMLTDYKKKTQAIAEERKKYSPDMLEKAKRFDEISRDQKFVDYWNGLTRQEKTSYVEAKAQAEQALGQEITDEEFSKAWESKDGFIGLMKRVALEANHDAKKKIDELEQKVTQNEAADIVESFATQAGEDGKPLRPDFYALDEDNLISGYLSINPPDKRSGDAYLSRLNEAYLWAKSMTQKYYEKGKAEGLAIVQKKASASSQPPTNSTKQQYSGVDPKKLDVSEAVALARKGIRVPQD